MSSDSAPLSSFEPDSRLGVFSPSRYRADGGFSVSNSLQLVGLLGLTGMVLGFLGSVISRYFYLVLLFPIVIGACVGGVGTVCIKSFRIRHPALCGLAGFVAGCLAMLAMHYTDFRQFQGQLNAELGEAAPVVLQVARNIEGIRANWEEVPEEIQELVTDLESHPEGLRALRADSIWKYIDMTAHQGVELKRAARGGGGVNLGYVGSYVYWVVEALIVAGIAFAMMSSAAAEPFCPNCQVWKQGEEYGPFPRATDVGRSIEEGTLTAYAAVESSEAPDAVITLFSCPDGTEECPIDVRVERVTVNGKGETTKKRLTQMTYLGEALPALLAACQPPLPPETVEEEEPVGEPAAPSAEAET